MNLRSSGIIIIVVIALLGGLAYFVRWLGMFKVRGAPVVRGEVVARTGFKHYSVPSVDFTIRVEGGADIVHARTGLYLMDQVPSIVRFHYDGNSDHEVYLYEYERNPFWIFILCWSLALVFSTVILQRRNRGGPDAK